MNTIPFPFATGTNCTGTTLGANATSTGTYSTTPGQNGFAPAWQPFGFPTMNIFNPWQFPFGTTPGAYLFNSIPFQPWFNRTPGITNAWPWTTQNSFPTFNFPFANAPTTPWSYPNTPTISSPWNFNPGFWPCNEPASFGYPALTGFFPTPTFNWSWMNPAFQPYATPFFGYPFAANVPFQTATPFGYGFPTQNGQFHPTVGAQTMNGYTGPQVCRDAA